MPARGRRAPQKPAPEETTAAAGGPDEHVQAAAVVEVPVADEIDESFVAYAMSVITSRAIPDARDGLKPVQRRILWTMHEMGASQGSSFRKSARVVGDTMGRYHPHGDQAIYDALVRLAQPFSLRLPLVDPQGNFGSPDDPPAASRYTECRLAAAAGAMIDGAGEDTVDWVTSYDGEGREPSVLPAGVPQLLVNGAAGIAVGLTTSVWPHNLKEVADAVKAVMAADEAGKETTAKSLLRKLPGPDFPGGGVVVAEPAEIAAAYQDGKGAVDVRGRWHAEPSGRNRQTVVVTELPPGVGAETLIDKIDKALDDDKSGLSGMVASAADHSDRNGLRVEVKLRPGADPASVVEELCRRTPLRVRASLNCVALVGGTPATLGLADAIRRWVDHRMDVIRRRTQHRLNAAKRKLKLADAAAAAISAIDDTIKIIRTARDADTARRSLQRRLKIDEEQAEYVLNMTLRRINRLDHRKLTEDRKSLKAQIKSLEHLASSEPARRDALRSELDREVKAHGTPRRTQIISSEGDAPAAAGGGGSRGAKAAPGAKSLSVTVGGKIAVGHPETRPGRDSVTALTLAGEGTMIAVSRAGEAKRVPSDPGAAAGLFGKKDPAVGAGLAGDDTLVVFSDGSCRIVRLPADPPPGRSESWPKGAEAVAAWPLGAAGEAVAASSDGKVLKFSLTDKAPGARLSKLMGLRDGASVAWAAPLGSPDDVIVLAAGSALSCFPAGQVPVKGRGAGGVIGMRVPEGQSLTAAAAGPERDIRLVPDRGTLKRLTGQPGKRDAAPKRLDFGVAAAGRIP